MLKEAGIGGCLFFSLSKEAIFGLQSARTGLGQDGERTRDWRISRCVVAENLIKRLLERKIKKIKKDRSIPCSLKIFGEQFDHSYKSPVQQWACEIGNTIEKDIFVNFVNQGSLDSRRKQGWSNSKKNFGFR